MIKTIDISKEANNIIKTIFCIMIASEDKFEWIKGFNFVDNKIFNLENGDRGEELFIWKNVKVKLNNLYGKKFILNKKK